MGGALSLYPGNSTKNKGGGMWLDAMKKLRGRMLSGQIKNQYPEVDDYAGHIAKCHQGERVLDVGCGHQVIKPFVKGEYVGIDAFPLSADVTAMKAEEMTFEDKSFDTVYCFAVLDGVEDLNLACKQIKRVCRGNIVILTGIDIEPDMYHTYKITEAFLDETFGHASLKYWVTDKVLLAEYYV